MVGGSDQVEPGRWVTAHLLDVHEDLVREKASLGDAIVGHHFQIGEAERRLAVLEEQIEDVLAALRELEEVRG